MSSPQWLACTVAQAVPEVRDSEVLAGYQGGGETESWAARERCCPRAVGGAFLSAGKGWAQPTYRAEKRKVEALLRSLSG